MTERPNIKAHLVLSSGGVKCLSYAGAIAELERSGVEIASVSACSGGSLAGALYCAGMPVEEKEYELDKELTEIRRKIKTVFNR